MLYNAIKLIKAVYGNPKAGHTHGGFPTISRIKVPIDQTQKLWLTSWKFEQKCLDQTLCEYPNAFDKIAIVFLDLYITGIEVVNL